MEDEKDPSKIEQNPNNLPEGQVPDGVMGENPATAPEVNPDGEGDGDSENTGEGNTPDGDKADDDDSDEG